MVNAVDLLLALVLGVQDTGTSTTVEVSFEELVGAISVRVLCDSVTNAATALESDGVCFTGVVVMFAVLQW